MTWADEGKNQNGESKKPELLPTGDEAKEILDVLAAMFRDTPNPEDSTNADAKREDACPDNEGQEQFG